MKTKIIFQAFALLICFAGCTGQNPKTDEAKVTREMPTSKTLRPVSADSMSVAECFEESKKSTFTEKPIFNQISTANSELMLLHYTLYRYTDSLSEKKIEDQVRWMRMFQKQLCRYYDTNKLGSETITCYAKVDTVLSHAKKLWEIDVTDSSTAEITISEDGIKRWNIFRQYNSLLQLLDLCRNEEQRNLLIKEWVTWEKLRVEFEKLFTYCVHLCYWRGSICSPLEHTGVNAILRTRIKMNNREIEVLNNSKAEPPKTKVPLSHAEELFVKCNNAAIKENFDIEMSDNEEDRVRYQELYNKSIQQSKKIKLLLKDWIKARSEWSKEFTCYQYYQKNTSEVLVDLANIISQIRNPLIISQLNKTLY